MHQFRYLVVVYMSRVPQWYNSWNSPYSDMWIRLNSWSLNWFILNSDFLSLIHLTNSTWILIFLTHFSYCLLVIVYFVASLSYPLLAWQRSILSYSLPASLRMPGIPHHTHLYPKAYFMMSASTILTQRQYNHLCRIQTSSTADSAWLKILMAQRALTLMLTPVLSSSSMLSSWMSSVDPCARSYPPSISLWSVTCHFAVLC